MYFFMSVNNALEYVGMYAFSRGCHCSTDTPVAVDLAIVGFLVWWVRGGGGRVHCNIHIYSTE
jgi:hypothetical protein